MIDKATLKLTLPLIAAARERYAEYDQYVKEEYARGFRPQYCIHGTNNWTDYDNICGPCEDGLSRFNYEHEALSALYTVRKAQADSQARATQIRPLIGARDLPSHVLDGLIDWACAPVIQLTK